MKDDMQKITVNVPAGLLASAQQATGKGITETVCEGLEAMRRRRAYRMLKEMRGKVTFDMTWQELRDKNGDRDLKNFLNTPSVPE